MVAPFHFLPADPRVVRCARTQSKLGQRYWEHVSIELWIGAGPWHRTDVNHKLDFRLAQQLNELSNRTCRVPDGEEWMRHL
jgi:hypothetical protein